MTDNFKQTSFLFGSNAVFVEELYQRYLANPNSVDQSWQIFFKDIKGDTKFANKSTAKIITEIEAPKAERVESSATINKFKAKALIEAYRKSAHYLVKLDPLNLEILKTKEELGLQLENFGFTNDQLNDIINIDGEFLGLQSCTLKELINYLDQVYATHIAIEFEQVENAQEKSWLFEQIDTIEIELPKQQQILQDLVEIEGFEQYIHVKFPGAKRFSAEGGEASVVALDKSINISMELGVEEIVIGMAHRGRLNTLTKVMGKPYKALLAGFMTGNSLPTNLGISGDVKYHIGYSSDRVREKTKAHLSLADNPSHLEAVNAVVAGKARAKQDIVKDAKKVMAILIHGDAAFCGQGVVAESLMMSTLEAYKTGGILHFVINNQVGFTANSKDTRTGKYSTEFAKIIKAPILHVNGDDIEAVLKATKIAVSYRQKFGKDVVIEIVCYRKYGHNEGDEPLYTQGVMYNAIKSKSSPATVYAEYLLSQNIIDSNHFPKLKEQFKLKMDQEYEEAKKYQPKAQYLEGLWKGFVRSQPEMLTTGIDKKVLQQLGTKLCEIPKDFSLNPKLIKLFEQRATTINEDKPIDWATAEQLAFASLLNSGTNIRLTGQDSGRGTFSHRHSVLHDQQDDTTYLPLNNLSENQGRYEVADSNLSEYAVLGFEYGYSLVNPNNLVIWEAQFGDFANGGQIVFDQFISAAEAKWLRMSGLVVLLPHGFEGQGPEHSSARLERFLQLAAEDNIQVVYPTTPASIFHLLRRQICSNIRKPLIVMTPKSLLRHKLAVSTLTECSEETSFIPILDEVNDIIKPENITRLILCSGKVYYDLLEMRTSKNITDIAIIRLEQLYPFEKDEIIKLLRKYNNAKEFIWCQEEPKNMGAWQFVKPYLEECLQNNKISYVGREEAASPAAGSLQLHNAQQEKLLKEALKVGEK